MLKLKLQYFGHLMWRVDSLEKILMLGEIGGRRRFWTVVLEKTLESPLDCKEIQPVHPKGDQSWVFIGRPDAEAESPILWPPDVKSWLIVKDPDAGKNWQQKEKGTTEDEMAGWHHGLHGRQSEWTLGVGDGQGGLAFCDSWGIKELDMPEWLNWTELKMLLLSQLKSSWGQILTDGSVDSIIKEISARKR